MPDLSGRRDNVQPRPSEKDHEHLAALGRCLAIMNCHSLVLATVHPRRMHYLVP